MVESGDQNERVCDEMVIKTPINESAINVRRTGAGGLKQFLRKIKYGSTHRKEC